MFPKILNREDIFPTPLWICDFPDKLKEINKIKLETPKVMSMKISVKHIDRLITEWAKPVPFDKMLSEIKEREEKEKQKELMMRGD